ncbi:mitotic interactor and substrate of PLK1 [Neomonachus schauinslandi]|uniref:Mitotic interactor and substrate of PLK1 n=1 Tax=Neomonachus schauinslandi TaxID=29088 RepID=A0A2Y9IBQ5_NEOSC|nr:mitotic interactor and substrate of PLK1 [Neomonachus schauinslandi]
MDRVTRYPIFSIPHSPRLAGLDPDGDTSYTFEVVDVGPAARGWGQDKPQAWPAYREAQLNAARTGASYTQRAFPGRSPPWMLSFREGDKDEEVKACRLDARDTQPRRPRDLEKEHWAVIQHQALRKNSTVATLHGTPGHLDPRSPGQPQPGPLEASAVDREQIDFLAAKRQFLSLEQANAGGPLHPPAQVAPARAPPGLSQAPKASSGLLLANGCDVPLKPQEREVLLREKRVCGLPAVSGAQAADDPGSRSQVGSLELPKETPIEREIRLAQEREADLREQRGLRRQNSQQELVEIPSRPLLTKVSLTAAPWRDRGRPSLYVQRDVAQETQREEDHRWQEGLQATPSRISRAPQSGLRRAFSSDSILDLASDSSAADPAPEVRKVGRLPADAYQPYLRPGSPRLDFEAFHAHGKLRGLSTDEAKAAGSPRATGSLRHLLESSGNPPGMKPECSKPPQGHPQAHGGVIRWEYFHLSPLRFRVPDVPPRAEGPRVRGWEVGGTLASRLQRSQSSELLEREVESVLQREQEVAEERRNALFPEVFSPPPTEDNDGGDQDSRGSSAASGIVGSYSVTESHFFSPIHLHSGLVWTAEAPAEASPEQRKREQQYAGIKSLDHIDSEVLEATRVTHHKNAMARRWEAGIYTSESQD